MVSFAGLTRRSQAKTKDFANRGIDIVVTLVLGIVLTFVWFLMLWIWGKIAVTAGLHRLWSHRSYKAHWTLRVLLMLLVTISNQGSIYEWVKNHRIHHKYSETDADLHNVRNLIIDEQKSLLPCLNILYELIFLQKKCLL